MTHHRQLRLIASWSDLAARQQPGKRGQRRPVRPGQSGGVDLPLEHGDLMAQDQDLGVLGSIGRGWAAAFASAAVLAATFYHPAWPTHPGRTAGARSSSGSGAPPHLTCTVAFRRTPRQTRRLNGGQTVKP
jgi:hypothetical protein